MSWTDDRTETAKRLHREGYSATQIAKQLGGLTRNAVIGKLTRLGLSRRDSPREPSKSAVHPVRIVASKPTPEQGGSTPLAARAKRLIVIVERAAPEPGEPRHPRHDADLSLFDGPGGRPWTERRFGECAWPVGGDGADVRSCCAPVAVDAMGEPASAYCGPHHRAGHAAQTTTARADKNARKDTLKAARAA